MNTKIRQFNSYQIVSSPCSPTPPQNLYKTDFNTWLKGLGWVPIQSLEVENAKNATQILSENKYRQHPDKLKYTIDMDAMEQVLAKQNANTMDKVRKNRIS